jgi:uncharacterized protein
MAFLDTSVLGSYYCPESLSPAVNRAVGSIDQPVISHFVDLEFCSLLAIKVRTNTIDQLSATTILGQFRLHQDEGWYHLLEVGTREYDLARNWLAGFTTSLRTVDALHLATAFANQQVLWTTDITLAKAADQLRVPYQLISS